MRLGAGASLARPMALCLRRLASPGAQIVNKALAMPRLFETAIMTSFATAVCVANAVHPLLHSAEGGSVDAFLDMSNQFVFTWLESRNR